VWLRDVRAVFFDAVGTVIHPEPPAGAVYAEVGLRHGSRLCPATIRARFAAAFRGEEERDRSAGLRTDEAREVLRWRNIVAAVLDDVGDPDACFAELWTHFTRPTSWRCDPDAAALMRRLDATGRRLGLASNFDARLRSVVAGLPELAGIDRLTISSEVGWRKPAPEFFAAVCRSVGAAPDQVLLVGDDRGNDYDGATAAGLRAVLFDPAGRQLDVAARVSRLDELWA
jgi:putative hydrolase of the HAD superfamily